MAGANFVKKIQEKGLKYIFTQTIPWIFFDIFDKPMTAIIKKMFINKPLRDIIVIESHNDFDSNGGAFYNYLIDNGYNKRYKIVWFLRNPCPKNLPENVEGYRYNRMSIKRVYYHCVAKYIVCGHYMIPSIRNGQVSYYTTHGAFGLKGFKGNIILPSGLTYILSPSEYLKPILAKQYEIEYPNNRQIILGFPSHDILYNCAHGELSKLTKKAYKKMILWMPTFRKGLAGRNDSKIEAPLGIPIITSKEDYQRLNDTLKKENALLVIKIHPMQDMSTVKIETMSNIIVVNGAIVKKLNVDNYRLMVDADALISDYSSVAYDYLHLNRPLAYTMDDANDYKVGFVVDDPKTLMAGNVIYNFSDLSKFVSDTLKEKDSYKEKRMDLSYKIWTYHDGNSCKRLAEHMGLIADSNL